MTDDTGMPPLREFVADVHATQKAQYMECPEHGYPFDLDNPKCPFCKQGNTDDDRHENR